jgi:hypothetical protein
LKITANNLKEKKKDNENLGALRLHEQFDRFNPPKDIDLILCAGDITNFGFGYSDSEVTQREVAWFFELTYSHGYNALKPRDSKLERQ